MYLFRSHFIGHGQRTFDILFGQEWYTGPDPANHWNFLRLWESGSSGLADDVNGTRANSFYVTLLFQGL